MGVWDLPDGSTAWRHDAGSAVDPGRPYFVGECALESEVRRSLNWRHEDKEANSCASLFLAALQA